MAMDQSTAESMFQGAAPGTAFRPAQGNLTVVSCQTSAKATIRQGIDGRQQFVIQGSLRDSAGSDVGWFQGVYQTKAFSKSDLLAYPEPPAEPFDRHYAFNEEEWTPLLNPVKSKWILEQMGCVVTGAGLGLSRIRVEPGGSTTFWYSTTSFLFLRAGGAETPAGQAVSLATANFASLPSLRDGMSFPVEMRHLLSLVAPR